MLVCARGPALRCAVCRLASRGKTHGPYSANTVSWKLGRTRQPSVLTVIPRWRVFPRDSHDARVQLAASNARRRFGRTFGTRDYAFTREGDDAVSKESTSILDHIVALDRFLSIPSAMTSANVLHDLAVPTPHVALVFGMPPLHMEGYMAAMFERLVTLQWFWQIGDAALHEAS